MKEKRSAFTIDIPRQKFFLLLKNLPNCPKGRLFKEDVNGNYFHSMTDDEVIEGKLTTYLFTKDEVLSNKKWFVEVTHLVNSNN